MVGRVRSAARRKRQHKAVDEYCSYVVEIKDWELTYSLGLNPNQKILSGQYMESLHLKIKGSIRLREKYSAKDMVSTFIGDREIFPMKNESDFKPRCIGAITLRGERREFLGVLPFDSLPIINSLMETKQVQFLDLNSFTPRHGHADITWIHFFKNYDPSEY